MSTGTPRVLVLDGEQRSSLAVTRSLVRAGYAVSVTAQRQWSLAGAARGATPHRLAADPLANPLAYAREIAALAAATGAALVIPVTDASADALLSHPGLLPSDCKLPFAPAAVYEGASDKVTVHRFALQQGVGIAESVVLAGPDAEPPMDARMYPAVIKPHRSVVGASAKERTSVRFVESADDCRRTLEQLSPLAFPVLVQRRIYGPGEGVFVARWQGRTIARFAHRRLREKPPAGGVSVYRESIALNDETMGACDRLLDALDWDGVAMIEGKRDVETGRWYVMEINGRFWGSLQLAIDAGVDFPALLARAVLDGRLGAPPPWRAGIRLRWEWGDIDHLLLRMLRSRERLAMPDTAPGRLTVLGQWLTIRPGQDRLEVCRLGDPMPFIVESLERLGVVR